ncbi:hypothetical protein V2J09_006381 [Rumex salicifolius]
MATSLGLMFVYVTLLAVAAGSASWAAEPPTPKATGAAAANVSLACEGDGGGTTGLIVGAYLETCPEAEMVVLSRVTEAVVADPRMAASLLRLHFHDCFGCEASVLLDDTADWEGEKGAAPNLNSLRGFEVIDAIKSDLEALCPATVSCADILAIAARDSVMLCRGPVWEVETGRRDGRSASKAAANANLPAPNATLATLATIFQNVGLTLTQMVALSGGHTVGKARCSSFSSRLQEGGGSPDGDADAAFLQSLSQLCSPQEQAAAVAELDLVTPATFDNQYYINLLSGEGLLASDQVLTSDDTRDVVSLYAHDPNAFFADFAASMVKMGRISVLTADVGDGQIRRNCRAIN